MTYKSKVTSILDKIDKKIKLLLLLGKSCYPNHIIGMIKNTFVYQLMSSYSPA